jgi:hypothetical protein
MYFRLYFLLPDEQHAQAAMNSLRSAAIDERKIRAHKRHKPSSDMADQASWQRLDPAERVEKIAWRADLAIFFLALLLVCIAWWQASVTFAVVGLLIMAACFLLGNFFAEYIPRVHLREFEHALSHGEVLLMVDVPHERVAEIEGRIHREHPAAIAGGSSWTIQSLGI